jgi:predicted alpha/beta superfamily hydrolase
MKMNEALIRVFYPLESGRIVLRTEQDWDRDLEPEKIDRESHSFTFRIRHPKSLLFFKPCIRRGSEIVWAKGANKLAVLHKDWPQDVYPFFFSDDAGTITSVIELPSRYFAHKRLMRLYLPAGYHENTLKRYPVIYMHDGKNLFFPQEAFLGQDWNMDGNLYLLNEMNLTEQVIVVGIYAGDREAEYTHPGYEKYGTCLVEEIKPWIDSGFRTHRGPTHTCVMGSSLGGVVSFYLAWAWPDVFGAAACLSSTFAWKDNLFEMVARDPLEQRRQLSIYLDSGWPGDNYDATIKMASALLDRGLKWGYNFFHIAFPLAQHSESDWASRIHIPMQLFFGRIRKAYVHFVRPDYGGKVEEISAGEEVEV